MVCLVGDLSEDDAHPPRSCTGGENPMIRGRRLTAALGVVAGLLARGGSGAAAHAGPLPQPVHGVLVTPRDVTAPRLRAFKQQGTNTIVLYVADDTDSAAVRAAVARIRKAGLAPCYWIEV